MIAIRLIFLFFSTLAFAEDHYLLDREGFLKFSYIKEKKFSPGDRLIFSPDRVFIFEEMIGQGNTTAVLKVTVPGEGRSYALRIPQRSQKIRSERVLLDFLNSYGKGFRILEEMELPTVQVHDFQRDRFILTSLESLDFTLTDLINPMGHLNKELKEKAMESLADFLKAGAMFSAIGDFHYGQLAYNINEDRWILVDWAEGHRLIHRAQDPYFFNLKMVEHETRYRSQLYEEKFNRPMPSRAIESSLKSFENFFEGLGEELRVKRLDLMEKDRENFAKFIQTLENSDNLLEEFLSFKAPATNTHQVLFRQLILDYFEELLQEGLSLADIKTLSYGFGKVQGDEFIEIMKSFLPLFKTIEDISWFVDEYNGISLEREQRKEFNHLLTSLLARVDYGDKNTLSFKIAPIFRSPLINHKNKNYLNKKSGARAFSHCLKGLERLFK